MKYHYGFDPGKTTGYAITDENGKILDYGQLDRPHLNDFLNKIEEAKVFVIENFLIRPDKRDSFVWSDMETVRIIGQLEFRAFQLGCRAVLQQPSLKTIGYKWGGISIPSSHAISHQFDAYAHVVYYNTKYLGLPIPAIERMKLDAKEQGREG